MDELFFLQEKIFIFSIVNYKYDIRNIQSFSLHIFLYKKNKVICYHCLVTNFRLIVEKQNVPQKYGVPIHLRNL